VEILFDIKRMLKMNQKEYLKNAEKIYDLIEKAHDEKKK
jgi:hypothetical protein